MLIAMTVNLGYKQFIIKVIVKHLQWKEIGQFLLNLKTNVKHIIL